MADNHERYREMDRARYWRDKEKNLEKKRAKDRAYVKSDAGKERSARDRHRRRAPGEIPAGFKKRQFEQQGGKCYGCAKRFKSERYMTIDHLLAVSKGGDNTESNLALMCKSCNASKHAKPEAEWRRARGQLL